MAIIDLRNVSIYIKDGSGKAIVVNIGEGNLTYDEKRTVDYIRNRGILDTVKLGQDEPMDVRLDAIWDFITTAGATGSPPPTVEDAMKQRGYASTWVSSSADPCEPYSVDIELLNVPPCAVTNGERIILPEFRWESINHDLKAGTLAFTGKCNALQANVTHGTVTS